MRPKAVCPHRRWKSKHKDDSNASKRDRGLHKASAQALTRRKYPPVVEFVGTLNFPSPLSDTAERHQLCVCDKLADGSLRTQRPAFDDGPLEFASATGRYEWSAADDRLVWSDGLLRIFGLASAPSNEADFSCLVHPDDRVRVQAETDDFLSSEASSYSHTFRILRPGGAVRFVLDRGSIERDADGRVICIRGINVDLTDLPQISACGGSYDEGAAQRFAELEALYAEAPLGLAMLDRDLRFVRINTKLAEINGFSLEQHLGRRVWDLVPDLRRSAEPALLQVLETGLPLRDVVIVGETPSRPGVAREWREHFYPLRGSDGLVKGIGIVCEEVTEQVAAQRALSESEARLAAALRAGGLGVHEFDPRSGIIKWDDMVRGVWGVRADEPIDFETFATGIHPDDRANTLAAVHKALDPDGSAHYEAVYRVVQRQTGDVRWVRADGDVTFEGRIAAKLVGTVQDITERKRIDAALQLSEQRFKLAIAGSPITVFEQDRALRYQWVYNPRFGFSEAFCIGKTDDGIMDPASANMLMAFKRHVIESGRPDRQEVVAGPSGGPLGVFDLHMHPRRDDSGRVIGLTCVSTDITERKHAERALRESEQRFRNMADNAPVMVWVTEPNGFCTYLSKSWYEFTGQTPEEAIGFGWLEAVNSEDRGESERVFREANLRQEPFQLDYRLRRADGVYRWAIDSARPRFGANGEFLGFIGSVFDITERKAAEAQKAFLLKLSDVLRPLASAEEVQAEAARILCEELRADRAVYYEIHGDSYIVNAEYGPGMSSVLGRHPAVSFGIDLLERHRLGQPMVVGDVSKTHSEAELANFRAIQIGAFLGVPLVKGGQFIAGFTVHSMAPRVWTEVDVKKAEETAERTWSAIERMRAEERRRESEARYRLLFESIDEGFCIIEIRSEPRDGRIDYRVVEANPAFFLRTGFPETILGRWLREAAPELEEHWYETYGRGCSNWQAKPF